MSRCSLPLVRHLKLNQHSSFLNRFVRVSLYSDVAQPSEQVLGAPEILASDDFLLNLKKDLENSNPTESKKTRLKMKKKLSSSKHQEFVFQDSHLNQRYSSLLATLRRRFIDLDEIWDSYVSFKEFNKANIKQNAFLPSKTFDTLIEYFSFSQEQDNNTRLSTIINDKFSSGHLISNEECLMCIRSLCNDKVYHEALQFIEKWVVAGSKLDLPILNEALRIFSSLGDYTSCIQTFETIENNGLKPDWDSYSSLIEISLLRADFLKARKLFADMLSSGVNFDVKALNSVLFKFTSSKDWIGTRQVLEAGMTYNIKPHLTTLTIILKASMKNFTLSKNRIYSTADGRKNELAVINIMYEGLISSNNSLDKIAFSVFVNWYVFLGDLKAAYSVLEDMEERGVCPDIWEYSILIRGHKSMGQWSKILYLYQTIKEKNLKIDEFTYNALIKALIQLRGADPEKILADINQGLLTPTSIVYDLCIKLFCRKNQFSEAFQVYQSMYQNKLNPTIFTITHFFERVCFLRNKRSPIFDQNEKRDSLLEILKTIFNDLTSNSLPCDLALYNMMIGAFFYLKDMDQTQIVYDQMLEKGFTPNSRTLKPIHENLVNGIDVDSAIAEILSHENQKHATITYHSFIQGLVFARQTFKALKVYRSIHISRKKYQEPYDTLPRRPTLNAAIYVTLIQGCLTEHDFEAVLSLLNDMLEQEMKLSTFLYHKISARLSFMSGLQARQIEDFLVTNFADTSDEIFEVKEYDSDINSQSQSDCFFQFKRLSIDYYNNLIQYSGCPPSYDIYDDLLD